MMSAGLDILASSKRESEGVRGLKQHGEKLLPLMHMEEEEEKNQEGDDSTHNSINKDQNRLVRHYRGARSEDTSHSGEN